MILQKGRAVIPLLLCFSTLYMAASSGAKTAFIEGSEGETSVVLYWMIDTSCLNYIHHVGSNIVQEIFEKAPLMVENKGCNNLSSTVNLIMYMCNKNFLNNISVLFKVILLRFTRMPWQNRSAVIPLQLFYRDKKLVRSKPNKTCHG